MGCGQSKIENEEAVSRCKDRKHLMKEAVSFRNGFAAAHSAYAMSLKNTGAALSDFAHGEVLNPTSTSTTTTNTTTTTQSLPATSASSVTAQPPPPPPDILPPPPPPITSSPLLRAASMPEMKLPLKSENSIPVGPTPTTIMEEGDGDDDDDDDEIESEKLVTRKRGSRREVGNDPPPPVVVMTSASPPPPTTGGGGVHDSKWSELSDYIFQPPESMMGPGLTSEEEVVKEDKVFDERPKRGEEVRKSAKMSVVKAASEKEKVAVVDTPVAVVVGSGGGSVGKSVKKGGKGGGGGGGGERRVGKGSVNLLEIFVDLDDHFLKASESAHEVSKMLEATRLHYHSNFADNRGNDL